MIHRCYQCRRFVSPDDCPAIWLLDTMVYAPNEAMLREIEELYDGHVVETEEGVRAIWLRANNPGPHYLCETCRRSAGPLLMGWRWTTTTEKHP